jgi:hypothetical protein
LGVFLPHLPAAIAVDGLHQLRSDPELQQLVGDQHVAAGAGAVFAHRDLLPVDADNPVAAHLARHPAVASSIRGARRLDHRPGRRHGTRRTRPLLVDHSGGVEPLSRGRIIEGLGGLHHRAALRAEGTSDVDALSTPRPRHVPRLVAPDGKSKHGIR